MEVTTTLYSWVLLLGAAHGVFLAVVLINVNSGNVIALRLLALLTLTFAIDLGVNFLTVSGYLVHAPRLVFVESVAAFLYGPLLYFYVLALTSREPWHLSARRRLHFLPFLVSIVLLVPFFGLSDEQLIEMIYAGADLEEQLGLWALDKQIVDVLPRLLIGAYLALGFRRLMQHGRHIREQFSLIEHISLSWLRNLLIAIGVLWLMYFVALAFGGKGLVENLLNVAIVIAVYTLGYMGLRQPLIFTQRGQDSLPAADERDAVRESPATADRPKYERSALDAESGKVLLGELETVMSADRPYLDSKLTLAQLAGRLKISPNYLSQIINQQTGSHFFDYINSHRVAAAKQILADPARAKTSVLTIAMDSGFNSKSAFYAAFRQHANITPSQYRQKKMS
ncbi:MAG: helix-turn-helix transcriptional regulator [Pseudomonadota bacterium]